MWKSLFLKRFFSAVSFFRKLFFAVFFLGLETGRLVFFTVFLFAVGQGDADDSCRDFLGVDR